MTRKDKEYKLVQLKKEIDAKLIDLKVDKIKELAIWLIQNEMYQRFKKMDTQLRALEFWKDIWLQEKQNLDSFELQGEAFAGIESLADAERKYLDVVFSVLRMERGLSYEYCLESIEWIINDKCSAYALFVVILKESRQAERVVLQLADLLIDRQHLVKGIGLLRLGIAKFPKNEDMILLIANAWILAKQWKNAYQYLCLLSEPTQDIEELKCELESMFINETV